jgi:hypothetical protein
MKSFSIFYLSYLQLPQYVIYFMLIIFFKYENFEMRKFC